MKLGSVAAVVVSLLATVAVARTVQVHTATVHSGTTITAPATHVAPARHYGNFACNLPTEADCEKYEITLPQ
jgi:hypothetical protein